MVVALANVKGGVGKTTSAVYLAALAAETAPVVLVDADPQASASEWLAARPISGVSVAEAPTPRLVERTLGDCTGLVVVDTPPGDERLVRSALAMADVVVIPTRAGGVEIGRVQATLGMVAQTRSVLDAPPPRGLVVTAAREQTRDYRETVAAWADAGEQVWASVPERVGIAAGPDGELAVDGLDAYRPALAAALHASAGAR